MWPQKARSHRKEFKRSFCKNVALLSCASIPYLTTPHTRGKKKKSLLKRRSKTASKHEEEWGRAERTCLPPSPRTFLPASQISVHRRGDKQGKKKKKKNLWLLVSRIIFHFCPHRSPAWSARGLRLGCAMFGFFPLLRRQLWGEGMKRSRQCSDWQTCPGNSKRHVNAWWQRS